VETYARFCNTGGGGDSREYLTCASVFFVPPSGKGEKIIQMRDRLTVKGQLI
jgi:hypothetical protein